MKRSPRWKSALPVMNSPSGKHIGEDPSQQPPDRWNISDPCCAVRRRSSSAASPVTSTRDTRLQASEEALGVRGVGHQKVLGLLVVVEHHLVVLAADP